MPQEYIDTSFLTRGLSSAASGVCMALGFRFTPGQVDYLWKDLQLPAKLDKFSILCSSLGLFYAPMHADLLETFSRHSAGMLDDNFGLNKVLVEVVTKWDGVFGRFFVLVCLGVGCTVWYAKDKNPIPKSGAFTPLDSYDDFFNLDYIPTFYPFKKANIS